VPMSAVQAGPEGSYAFVIRGDDTVEMRAVRIAGSWQGKALIESDLRSDDRVVVDGQYNLRQGVRVVETAHVKDTAGKTVEAERGASVR
jgi:membrane fusion protein, multidrug efflux system